MVIIGIAGRKGVGKSTAAARLSDIGYAPLSFAATLKGMVRLLLRNIGVTDSELAFSEINKESIIPRVGSSWRELCQTLGTDWGRSINPDLWLLAAANEMAYYNFHQDFVFDDIRFENEADFIRKQGGLIIHITRDTGFIDEHASEIGIAIHDEDIAINNCSSIDEFMGQIISAVIKYESNGTDYAHANR